MLTQCDAGPSIIPRCEKALDVYWSVGHQGVVLKTEIYFMIRTSGLSMAKKADAAIMSTGYILAGRVSGEIRKNVSTK